MSQRYTGAFVNAVPNPPIKLSIGASIGSSSVPALPSATAASGIWTQNQAMQYRRAGLWPNTVPINTSLPTVSGTLVGGSTLSAAVGSWSNSPTSYTYQWWRNGTAIGGATGSTYGLVNADIGFPVGVTVTAINAFGSTPASSAATNNIAAPGLGGQVISYSLGGGGGGGTDSNNGSGGGQSSATFQGTTIYGYGGGGGFWNSGSTSTGGSYAGGDGGATGGTGSGTSGDRGGGGGGGVGGNAGGGNWGTTGGNGGALADVSGLTTALSSAGYNYTSVGSGASSGSSNINNMDGGSASGFGCGGGGAGWYGGFGGNGYLGGGGGGAAGYTAGNRTGGSGGSGAMVLYMTGASYGTTYSVFTGGSSYTIPNNVTSIKIWIVGGGGGGAGSAGYDGNSGGAGAAGGVAYRTWTS